MKLFGHPLHMILIHFPSALLPMDFLFSIAAVCGGPVDPVQVFFSTAAAVVFGWLAVITGCIDLLKMVKEKHPALVKALIHATVNTVVLTGYTLFALISYKAYPDVQPDSTVKLAVKGILIVILVVGNHLGGSLILKHRVAVDKD